ncbi:NACHT domain-containing protein [Microcoleus sp. herbarium14]|uniref:NACHT domain-containing protein n=1 Tax=Microcoleus sp. herbarium14 TaxID=3055439 RepID=UPI002FD400FA
MEYYFNELHPIKFQRLINGILIAEYKEGVRLTPLHGADGGRDAETAPGNPYWEFQVSNVGSADAETISSRQGRYLFQVKHHRTSDKDARRAVISDFENELKKNVLTRTGNQSVNYFFLITNVYCSKDALEKLDKKRAEILKGHKNIHADIWWKEQLISFLDGMPNLWNSFPEMFAGGKVPFIANVASQQNQPLSRGVRMAINKQYERDSKVKFRQIELENNLSKLFVDLDVNIENLTLEERRCLLVSTIEEAKKYRNIEFSRKLDYDQSYYEQSYLGRERLISALTILLSDPQDYQYSKDNKELTRKIILEGGPGQGKSTLTQMAVQIYRDQILGQNDISPEKRWTSPSKSRLPFRIELRMFAERLSINPDQSIEEYIAWVFKQDSGGSDIKVDDIHTVVEGSPTLLVFDGLDEVGSDNLRDDVITKILECVNRFENDLSSDLRVIITTRPPAIAGRRERLNDFTRLTIASMENHRIQSYLERWLLVQLPQDEDEKIRVRESFERRKEEPLVKPLIKNPMQLSVLLHFIRLKGDAFPDHRAELYKEYFQIVIDRDVEKSPALRQRRPTIEALHQFLAYKIHALTEAEETQTGGTLTREKLLEMVGSWLKARGDNSERPGELFKLGEDRLGLIVTLKGEGEEARYGYEIQPIREYFTAAYIDQQIKGDANIVFAEMVRRPYWREVALFLAGLRRPKEKADLLILAKDIDNDENQGWRQDGRAIVLQLLQEGAFSDPPYVFADALKFVFDLLNYKTIPIQNEPEGLLETLSTLLNQNKENSGVKKLIEDLSRLLLDYQIHEDEYVLYRLYYIASHVFEAGQVREKLLANKSTPPGLTAKVRLAWPYRWSIDMREATRNSSFWEGVPPQIWAETWWNTALQFEEATNLLAPSSLHHYLILQFAANPISLGISLSRKKTCLKTISTWAVWRLLCYQQMVTLKIRDFSNFTQKLAEFTQSDIAKTTEGSFVGLDPLIISVIQDMIEVFHIILTTLEKAKEEEILNMLSEYKVKIVQHLRQPGLAGWVAFQCVSILLKAIILSKLENQRDARLGLGSLINLLINQNPEWQMIINELKILHTGLVNSSETVINDSESLSFLFTEFSSYYYYQNPTPQFIRIEPNGKIYAIIEILIDYVCFHKELPFDWIRYIPFTSKIIRPLVDGCLAKRKDSLPDLLTLFSELHFIHFGSAEPLMAFSMNRILKIVKDTKDPKILTGALVALSTSKFIKTAGPLLVIRLISANFNQASLACKILFAQPKIKQDNGNFKEDEIIKKVAQSILAKPEMYSLKIVCTAAGYLAEHEPISLPALLSQEKELGLQVNT